MMATTLWQRNRSLHSHKTDPEALALVALVFKSGALLSKDQYSFRVGESGRMELSEHHRPRAPSHATSPA
jgi:hypothetical protein